MLWVGSQHSKAHISQPLESTTTAVAEADQLKAARERERVAAETVEFLANAKATTANATNANANDNTTNASTSANASTSTSANAKATSNVKAKIQGYFDEKQLRAAALVAEEEAAEAERILNDPKAMDETNNANLKPTTNWADDERPPTPPTSQTPKK
jgi:hypothetical protein